MTWLALVCGCALSLVAVRCRLGHGAGGTRLPVIGTSVVRCLRRFTSIETASDAKLLSIRIAPDMATGALASAAIRTGPRISRLTTSTKCRTVDPLTARSAYCVAAATAARRRPLKRDSDAVVRIGKQAPDLRKRDSFATASKPLTCDDAGVGDPLADASGGPAAGEGSERCGGFKTSRDYRATGGVMPPMRQRDAVGQEKPNADQS